MYPVTYSEFHSRVVKNVSVLKWEREARDGGTPGRSGPPVSHSTCPQKLFENPSTGLKI